MVAGNRTPRPDGGPSRKAREGGYVSAGPVYNGHASYQWDADKTVAALENAGQRRKTPVSAQKIHGPFMVRQCSTGEYEIINGNGTTSITAREKNADTLVRLLNLVYEHGRLGGNK